jgi:hypothetical protein
MGRVLTVVRWHNPELETGPLPHGYQLFAFLDLSALALHESVIAVLANLHLSLSKPSLQAAQAARIFAESSSAFTSFLWFDNLQRLFEQPRCTHGLPVGLPL